MIPEEIASNPQVIVGDFDYRTFTHTFAGLISEPLIVPNANRVLISFGLVSGGAPIAINIRPLDSVVDGWALVDGGRLNFVYRDFGALVSGAWHALDLSAAGTMLLCEVIYIPVRGGK